MSRSPIRYLLASTAALGVLGLAAPVAYAAPANSDRFQMLAFAFNSCNGDFVQAQAQLHIVSKVNNDGSTTYHYDFHGQGTGQPSGADYVLNHNAKATFSTPTFTFDEQLRVISKGGEENQLMTFSDDGTTVTASSKCVG